MFTLGFTLGCNFYVFGQIYIDMELPLWYHTEYFHCPKTLWDPSIYPSPSRQVFFELWFVTHSQVLLTTVCSVTSSVVGLIVSCLFIPVNPAYVGDNGLSQAYGDPPLSGHDWHTSPQGKA